MWTRSLLKENAKIAFKRNYWTCVIVSVILMLLGGGAEGLNYNVNFDAETGSAGIYGSGYGSNIPIQITGRHLIVASFVGILAIIALVIAILISLFIVNIIMIGGRRYFMENREHKTMIGQVFYGFQSGSYMNCVKTMFFRELYIFGWTLLFIIPGIIKSYSYRLVPYILAENPGMDKDRALKLSSEMMSGNKLELFVLELSFIGWDIVSAFTVGIAGIFYVNPYKHATFAEFYAAVKAEAFNRGITNSIELPGFAYEEFRQEYHQKEQNEYFEDIFEEE